MVYAYLLKFNYLHTSTPRTVEFSRTWLQIEQLAESSSLNYTKICRVCWLVIAIKVGLLQFILLFLIKNYECIFTLGLHFYKAVFMSMILHYLEKFSTQFSVKSLFPTRALQKFPKHMTVVFHAVAAEQMRIVLFLVIIQRVVVNSLWKFRYKLSVPSSNVDNPFRMRPIGCTEPQLNKCS